MKAEDRVVSAYWAFLATTQFVLIVLKVTHTINWHWLVVFIPLIVVISAPLWGVIVLTGIELIEKLGEGGGSDEEGQEN